MNVIEGGKKDLKKRSVFPICTRAIAKNAMDRADRTEITHVNEGGVTLLEYTAIKFAAALLSNAAFVQANVNAAAMLRGLAISEAKKFLNQLQDDSAETPA